MARQEPIRIPSISAFHKLRKLAPPRHPLISVVDYADMNPADDKGQSCVFDFYTISVKRGVGKMFYGQQQYDFDEGVMYFMAPNQVLRVNPQQDPAAQRSGWILLIHPDFLWHTPLAKLVRQYDYFDYSVHEALFLSAQEEETLNGIAANIRREYEANIDRFSQNIILAQIETLLSYAERFYQRQFITRKISNHQLLDKLEELLDRHFAVGALSRGLPTVQSVADALHVSPGYLSSLLKLLTGQSTQQHIHHKLIETAKIQLSTTQLSVSEIAYTLGFEHPQSFSKLFKAKTNSSPQEFRASFS